MHTVDTIRSLVARALGIDEEAVTEDSRFGNPPEWDSAGHMFIVAELEEALNCLLDNDQVLALTDVQAILRLMEEITRNEKDAVPAEAVASGSHP